MGDLAHDRFERFEKNNNSTTSLKNEEEEKLLVLNEQNNDDRIIIGKNNNNINSNFSTTTNASKQEEEISIDIQNVLRQKQHPLDDDDESMFDEEQLILKTNKSNNSNFLVALQEEEDEKESEDFEQRNPTTNKMNNFNNNNNKTINSTSGTKNSKQTIIKNVSLKNNSNSNNNSPTQNNSNNNIGSNSPQQQKQRRRLMVEEEEEEFENNDQQTELEEINHQTQNLENEGDDEISNENNVNNNNNGNNNNNNNNNSNWSRAREMRNGWSRESRDSEDEEEELPQRISLASRFYIQFSKMLNFRRTFFPFEIDQPSNINRRWRRSIYISTLLSIPLAITLSTVVIVDWDTPCEKPLALWSIIQVGVVIGMLLLNYISIETLPDTRLPDDRQRPLIVNARVKTLYNATNVLYSGFIGWFLVGVVWTFQANATSCTWEKPFLFRGCFGVTIIGLIIIGLFVLVSLGIALFLSVIHYLYPPEDRPRTSRGASERLVKSLGFYRFKPNLMPKEDSSCAICLGDYEIGVKLRFLPCDHHFHKDCVDTWLMLNKTCPLCKNSISRRESLRE